MIMNDVEKHSFAGKIQLIRSASKLAELVEIMTGHVSIIHVTVVLWVCNQNNSCLLPVGLDSTIGNFSHSYNISSRKPQIISRSALKCPHSPVYNLILWTDISLSDIKPLLVRLITRVTKILTHLKFFLIDGVTWKIYIQATYTKRQ